MRLQRNPDALSIALAEPSRRALLESLRLGRKSVNELVHATGLKQPNASNHLARMREQGLLRSERIGRRVYYSIALPAADLLLRLHEAAHVEFPVNYLSPSLNPPAAPIPRMPEQQPRSDDSPIARLREAYFETVLEGREEDALKLVHAMLAEQVGLVDLYLGVFQTVLYRIGDLYVNGKVDVAHEHLASAITERMMARVAQYYGPLSRNGARALLGCVAGNYHTVGLRMIADALLESGWNVLYMGANVPNSSFVNIAAAARPDLVVISCALEEQVPVLEQLVADLSMLFESEIGWPCRLAYGGHCFVDGVRPGPLLDGLLFAPDLRTLLEAIESPSPE